MAVVRRSLGRASTAKREATAPVSPSPDKKRRGGVRVRSQSGLPPLPWTHRWRRCVRGMTRTRCSRSAWPCPGAMARRGPRTCGRGWKRRGSGEVQVGHRRLLPAPPLSHQPMALGGTYAKSSATSVGEKAAVAAAVAWTQRRRDPAASTPQTSAALTRAPASPSETGKAAPPPVPSLRAPVLPSHHHLRSSPPPVPLLWSVKGSGEGRSKEAVEAGPPGMPFSTTASALRAAQPPTFCKSSSPATTARPPRR